jgi:transmembrane sensor
MTRALLSKFMNPPTGVRVMMVIDAEKDWLKVKKQIFKKRIWITPMLKIAASVMLLLLAGFAVYRFVMPEKLLVYKTIHNSSVDVQSIAMDDGSTIYLNKDAEIVFPEDFKNDRRISLAGKGFFDVQRDESNPFRIKAQQCEVEVLGTAFSVEANSSQVEVIVKTGRVLFRALASDTIQLVKNQKGLFLTTSRKIVKDEDLSSNSFSWQTHVLVFENTSLDQVVEDLEKYFQVNIHITGNVTQVPHYTSRFETPTLKEILGEMRLILPINYSVLDNEVVIDIIE